MLPPPQKLSTFTHQFSGYSVWLSPNLPKSQSIINEMSKIAKKCGGEANGVHAFEPHCTLLYNFESNDLLKEKYSKEASIRGLDPMGGVVKATNNIDTAKEGNGNDSLERFKKKVAEALLQKCRDMFQHNRPLIDDNADGSKTRSLLKPDSFYFFPYPKDADDGKGFGCVVPLLLLENTPPLQSLHDIVSDIFPPDERHRKGDEQRHKIPNEGKFIPHMALCYAPEIYQKELEDYVETLKSNRNDLLGRLDARFLSVWNTEGGLADWNLIARIELGG